MLKFFLPLLVFVKFVLSPSVWALPDERNVEQQRGEYEAEQQRGEYEVEQQRGEYEVEQQLRAIFSSLANHQPLAALTRVNTSLGSYPDFGLLHLLKAEALSVLAHQPTLMAEPAAAQKRRIEGLWSEAKTRLAYSPPPEGHLPESILLLSSRHRHALIFSASQSRLFLFRNENGAPRYLRSFYASMGYSGLGKSREGDNRTPAGVYHLVSRIGKDRLPDLYGEGAYTMNYPNVWDKRYGRQGSGIWLHGVIPGMYSRPPHDSRGCIVASNAILRELKPYIKPGSTAIVVLQKINWLPMDAWERRRQSMLDAFLRWQSDWESLDLDAYLRHYSAGYSTEKHSYRDMIRQTRKNAKAKTYIRVDAEKIDIFQYPSEIELAMVVFNQNYQSNNYNIRYRKQQFWKREDAWKIIYEGRAESAQSP